MNVKKRFSVKPFFRVIANIRSGAIIAKSSKDPITTPAYQQAKEWQESGRPNSYPQGQAQAKLPKRPCFERKRDNTMESPPFHLSSILSKITACIDKILFDDLVKLSCL